jgi:hypothetical protein
VNSNFIERLAELASVRDEQLVAETQTPEARALLSEILATPVAVSTTNAPRAERRSRVLKRGRWLTVPALAATVAAVAVLVSTGSNGTPNAAAATLNKAAVTAPRAEVLRRFADLVAIGDVGAGRTELDPAKSYGFARFAILSWVPVRG